MLAMLIPVNVALATHLGFTAGYLGVIYNPDGTSIWSYQVDASSALHGLSHFVVGTCATGSPTGGSSDAAANWTASAYGTDPTTQLAGIKWDAPGDSDFTNGTLSTFTITLNDWYLPGTVQWATKAGNDHDDNAGEWGSVTGATCDTAPVARADEATTPMNTAVTFHILDNDSLPTGAPYTITFDTTIGTQGSPVLNSDNMVTFTPSNDYTGNTTFTYTVSYTVGTTVRSATATVTVTVTPLPSVTLSCQSPILVGGTSTCTATPSNPPANYTLTWSKQRDPGYRRHRYL